MQILRLLLLSLCITVLVLPTQAQHGKNEYVIKGIFKGLPDGTRIYLRTQESDTVNTTVSTNDTFVFRGSLKEDGRFHFIRFDTLVSKVSSKAVFVTNNDTIIVNGILGNKNVTVTNSPLQDEYVLMQKMHNEYGDKVNKVWEKINAKNPAMQEANARNDSATIKQLTKIIHEESNEINKIQEEFQNSFFDWLLDHANSMMAAYLYSVKIEEPTTDLEKLNKIYNNFSLEVKNSYYGKKAKELLSFKNNSLGIEQMATIPNFTVVDKLGKSIKIRDLIKRNHLTLIDCWASWCSPCRQEVPRLKEIYNTYKSKGLAIIGISSDTKKDQWEKAVKEDAAEWAHFLQESNKSVSKTFSIQSIPAYILVDSNGRLRAFDCAMSAIKSFGGSLRGDELVKTIEGNL